MEKTKCVKHNIELEHQEPLEEDDSGYLYCSKCNREAMDRLKLATKAFKRNPLTSLLNVILNEPKELTAEQEDSRDIQNEGNGDEREEDIQDQVRNGKD